MSASLSCSLPAPAAAPAPPRLHLASSLSRSRPSGEHLHNPVPRTPRPLDVVSLQPRFRIASNAALSVLSAPPCSCCASLPHSACSPTLGSTTALPWLFIRAVCRSPIPRLDRLHFSFHRVLHPSRHPHTLPTYLFTLRCRPCTFIPCLP
ncbi:hypothetical protein DFH08DRAFT_893982 [Mycena albidolilacea]|uniref:Uncharacterized protein n=1 Tax=Mycena albidolilacea TaxID=1033008 RepID=A0AAD6ZCH5_9AGAR|nr:hypothetical protein DFH08DRAFT_893982 [Mycena albidolilacea]